MALRDCAGEPSANGYDRQTISIGFASETLIIGGTLASGPDRGGLKACTRLRPGFPAKVLHRSCGERDPLSWWPGDRKSKSTERGESGEGHRGHEDGPVPRAKRSEMQGAPDSVRCSKRCMSPTGPRRGWPRREIRRRKHRRLRARLIRYTDAQSGIGARRARCPSARSAAPTGSNC